MDTARDEEFQLERRIAAWKLEAAMFTFIVSPHQADNNRKDWERGAEPDIQSGVLPHWLTYEKAALLWPLGGNLWPGEAGKMDKLGIIFSPELGLML